MADLKSPYDIGTDLQHIGHSLVTISDNMVKQSERIPLRLTDGAVEYLTEQIGSIETRLAEAKYEIRKHKLAR